MGFVVAFLFFVTPTLAADGWPGDSGSVIGNAGNLGAGYEPSGIVYHSVRNQLVLVGDDGDITTMTTAGSIVDTENPNNDDLEGVAIVDTTTNFVYVGVENPDSIKEYNLNSEEYTGKEWTLTAWMTGAANQGLEALTFVPNGFHPYSNSSSGGLFYAGLQQDGKIYVFDVDTGTSESVTHIDTITVNPSRTDISGLDYNNETNLLYIIFDSFNELVEMELDETISNSYVLPGNSQEGISIVSSCPSAGAKAYVAEDSGPEVWAYGSYSVSCPEEDQDPDDGDGDGGTDGDDGDSGTDGGTNDGTQTEQYRSKNTIITTPGSDGTSQLRTFNYVGEVKYTPGFQAYADSLRVGFNVVSGDLNGDGKDEIIVAPRHGGAPHIRIFNHLGDPVFTPGFYAYSEDSRCGVDLATGDLNGDGKEEIITIPGEGCPAHVKVFNFVGESQFTLGFHAYDTNLTTGFRVTAGDLNGDGLDEIVTAPEKNAPAHVRIFNYIGKPKFTPGFYAYASNLGSGADITSADLDNNGKEEIITVPGEGFPAHVRTFNFLGESALSPGFYAYNTNVTTGFNVTAGDLNNDRQAEIIVSPKNNVPAHIRIFDYLGQAKFIPGFYAYNQQLPLGADVTLGRF